MEETKKKKKKLTTTTQMSSLYAQFLSLHSKMEKKSLFISECRLLLVRSYFCPSCNVFKEV